MDERPPDTSTSPAGATLPRRRSHRPLRWAASFVLGLAVVVAALVGALIWALHDASGSAWLLDHVPQLKVTEPRGSLLGDFAARRVDIALPGTAGTLRLDQPRWHALAATRGDHGRWLRLTIDTLHVDRVTFLPAAKSPTTPASPMSPPTSLRLPIEVLIRDASVDTLRFGNADDASRVTALHGRIHLGAIGGASHRFESLAGRYEQASVTGAMVIAADAPFDVDAHVLLAYAGDPQGSADATVAGPLASLHVSATVRIATSTTHPAQSLDADAVLHPFAAWPLGALTASARDLDLSAFASAAPATSLSGRAVVESNGLDMPAKIDLEIANGRAGRWNEGLLPLRRLHAEIQARPDDASAFEIKSLFADLGSARDDGGRVQAQGRWTADRWTAELTLDKVRPAVLDARAPETSLDGTATLVGSGFAAAAAEGRRVEAKLDVSGAIVDRRLPKAAPRQAQIRLDLSDTGNVVDLRSAEARLGNARATLQGRLTRTDAKAPWRAAGKVALVDFDPAPWWPGDADALFSRGINRLNVKGDFDLLPSTSVGLGILDMLAATRGKATLSITDSRIAGVPLEGEASFAGDGHTAKPALEVVAAGNRAQASGVLVARSGQAKAPRRDAWQARIDAPHLQALAPLLRPPGPAASAAVGGTLTARARVDGRWPDITSEGELHGATLRYGDVTARSANAQWNVGFAADAPLAGKATIDGLDVGGRGIDRVVASIAGTARRHRLQLRADTQALPPAWVDAIAAAARAQPESERGAASVSSSDTAASQPSAAKGSVAAVANAGAAVGADARSSVTQSRSALVLDIEGGFVDAGGQSTAGWTGTVHDLLAEGTSTPTAVWLHARDLHGSLFWSGGPPRATLDPGKLQALGTTVQWSQLSWQGGETPRLDVRAAIDPLPIAPVLRILQPDFGWGGDLAIGGHIDVRSTPTVTADVVVERARGDLSVSDEYGTRQLGLSDLRLGVAADDGVWHFTAALAGSTLGVASAAVTARTSASAAWPAASTPIQGVAEVRVDDLGSWGRWLPAGWRLAGEAHASASIGGRFGAPEYTGRVEASKLGVRNFLEGVNVTDGQLAIALHGEEAHIEHFSARGGEGQVELTGNATFGSTPAAHLALRAEHFQLLGRVDRRIVVSGNAAIGLDAHAIDVTGKLGVDEGLIDFTRSDAPTLGDDVEVVRRPVAPAANAATASATPVLPPEPTAEARLLKLDLRVSMGEKLRIRGRGLDARLTGDLRLTSPDGRLALDGTLRVVDGTYQAYGQKLGIDRGILGFVGPIANPRLDIEATRPNLDVRVGVTVTGTALNPRIRLFSEPDMSDIDKLSWLVLGRASAGVGADDMALLQSAALALLSGEGPGVTDRLTKAIGLDTIGVRQQTEGAVKETIVSLGKQISKRWYVGYERGLNATAGSWQLIYRIARRFTVRAQAGGDNSIDLNWTLRWN